MSRTQSASEQIIEEVGGWPDVDVVPGDRGSSVAFKVGRREIGHLHGDRAAHFGFPKEVFARLVKEGQVGFHPVFPDKPGPAARTIEDEADVQDVIDLFRLNYDRVS